MQYQVTCNHCHQLYVVDAAPGATIRSRCPYCGQVSTVATPCGDASAGASRPASAPVSPQGQGQDASGATSRRPASSPQTRPTASDSADCQRTHRASRPVSSSLTRRVVVVFCVAAVLLILLATVLYVAFSGMSAAG